MLHCKLSSERKGGDGGLCKFVNYEYSALSLNGDSPVGALAIRLTIIEVMYFFFSTFQPAQEMTWSGYLFW